MVQKAVGVDDDVVYAKHALWMIWCVARFALIGLITAIGLILWFNNVWKLSAPAWQVARLGTLFGLIAGVYLTAVVFNCIKRPWTTPLQGTLWYLICGSIPLAVLHPGPFDLSGLSVALRNAYILYHLALAALAGMLGNWVISVAVEFGTKWVKKNDTWFATLGVMETLCPAVGGITCFALVIGLSEQAVASGRHAESAPESAAITFFACSISVVVAEFLCRMTEYKGESKLPATENDEMLLPAQIAALKHQLTSCRTPVLAIQDPLDELLPEAAYFVPNLLGEFNVNPRLAMVHADGRANAWIDVRKIREVLDAEGDSIVDYRTLFGAIAAHGYEVKKIDYVYFRSALGRYRSSSFPPWRGGRRPSRGWSSKR